MQEAKDRPVPRRLLTAPPEERIGARRMSPFCVYHNLSESRLI
jgi:hypothetical protein